MKYNINNVKCFFNYIENIEKNVNINESYREIEITFIKYQIDLLLEETIYEYMEYNWSECFDNNIDLYKEYFEIEVFIEFFINKISFEVRTGLKNNFIEFKDGGDTYSARNYLNNNKFLYGPMISIKEIKEFFESNICQTRCKLEQEELERQFNNNEIKIKKRL